MARLGDSRDHGDEGVRDSGSMRNPRTVAILCAIAILVAGFGLWLGTSSQGVELSRAPEGTEEPVDPEGADGEDPGEADDGEGTEDAADGEGEADDPLPACVKVHVDGAVAVPGVYELYGADPRVADAVGAAGGLTDEADTAAVNLAAQLHDADKVHIPRREEQAPAVESVAEVPAGSSTTSTAGSDASAATAPAASAGPININSASAEELTALPGIGEKTAEKIVADRDTQGPFASPEDLMRVSGIGEKKFAQVKDLICV